MKSSSTIGSKKNTCKREGYIDTEADRLNI